MAIEKVKEYFRGFGIEDRIMEFFYSPQPPWSWRLRLLGADRNALQKPCPFWLTAQLSL